MDMVYNLLIHHSDLFLVYQYDILVISSFITVLVVFHYLANHHASIYCNQSFKDIPTLTSQEESEFLLNCFKRLTTSSNKHEKYTFLDRFQLPIALLEQCIDVILSLLFSLNVKKTSISSEKANHESCEVPELLRSMDWLYLRIHNILPSLNQSNSPNMQDYAPGRRSFNNSPYSHQTPSPRGYFHSRGGFNRPSNPRYGQQIHQSQGLTGLNRLRQELSQKYQKWMDNIHCLLHGNEVRVGLGVGRSDGYNGSEDCSRPPLPCEPTPPPPPPSSSPSSSPFIPSSSSSLPSSSPTLLPTSLPSSLPLPSVPSIPPSSSTSSSSSSQLPSIEVYKVYKLRLFSHVNSTEPRQFPCLPNELILKPTSFDDMNDENESGSGLELKALYQLTNDCKNKFVNTSRVCVFV